MTYLSNMTLLTVLNVRVIYLKNSTYFKVSAFKQLTQVCNYTGMSGLLWIIWNKSPIDKFLKIHKSPSLWSGDFNDF